MEEKCNSASIKKAETFLESKLSSLTESNKRLRTVLEKVEHLEHKLSGDNYKADKKSCGDEPSPQVNSIVNNFNGISDSLNQMIDDLFSAVNHLEELI